jgi:alkaline phosphatase D
VQRRGFLAGLASGFAAACTPLSEQDRGSAPNNELSQTSGEGTTTPSTSAPPLTQTKPRRETFVPASPSDPFGFGVASGDPTSSTIVLWTRLADADGQPVSTNDVTLTWRLAADEAFSNVLQSGEAVAQGADGHSVHVLVADLQADTTIFYRFELGEHISIVGRTWTLPDQAAPRAVRLAACSCQQYEEGFFGAYRGMDDDDPDLVVHLGDYVYERRGTDPIVRTQPAQNPTDLVGIRSLWAAARTDSDLAAAHASRPWVMMWDDHEIAGDHAGRVTGGQGDAAYQAWWEFQPTSAERPVPGVPFVTHRMVDLGTARLWLLDTRQYRSVQVCEALPDLPGIERCDEVDDPARTMLGSEQEQWLYEGINPDDGRWDIVAQQTVMADLSISLAGPVAINNDQWDGYPAARERLLAAFSGHERAMVLSGDLHAAMVNSVESDLVKVGTVDGSGTSALPEIVTPSVTTHMSSSIATGLSLALLGKRHISMFDPDLHGYVLLDVDPLGVVVRFRQADERSQQSTTVDGPVYEIPAGASVATAH